MSEGETRVRDAVKMALEGTSIIVHRPQCVTFSLRCPVCRAKAQHCNPLPLFQTDNYFGPETVPFGPTRE